MTHDELIREYTHSGFDRSVLASWYKHLSEIDATLDDLSIYLGRSYVNGEIPFDTANGVLNQLMPLRGFDEAPLTFWKFYVGFEDFEGRTGFDVAAKSRITGILRELNAI